MADKEARPANLEGEPIDLGFASKAMPAHSSLSHRDGFILQGLATLGITAQHTASLATLRTFRRAREAVGVLYDTFGNDLEDFLTQPLADYGGKSVVDLVAEHGVRALEAIRTDVEYPIPA